MESGTGPVEDFVGAALDLIRTHTTMSLGTAPDGSPHVVSLLYAHEGFSLFWVSDPRSRHSRALAENGAASVAIADHFDDFTVIRGLQCVGTARELQGEESSRGLEMLAARFGFLEQFVEGPASLVRRLRLASVYRFDAAEVTLVDNTKGFGHKDRFRPLPPGASGGPA